MFVSHAQNFEDVILWRALKDVQNGFFIDVGAFDPEIDSVSFAFHQRGWRGVHVEPLPAFADRLRALRPHDDVIQACIGETPGATPFHNIANGGLSSARADVAAANARTHNLPMTVETVECLRLSDVLDRYKNRDIHWLKIDVEGFETQVLRSWAGSDVRPWIVLIECVAGSAGDISGEWQHIIEGLGYRFAYFDGLNKFFVSTDHLELLRHLDHGPCVFDDFTLAGTSSSGFTRMLAPLPMEAPASHVGGLHEEAAPWTPEPAAPAAPTLKGAAAVFVVRDIEASLAYYRDALGFLIDFRWGDPCMYACLCRNDVSLHLLAAKETKRAPGESGLCIFVTDVDAIHAEIAAKGAKVTKAPETYAYGMREFNVVDLDGNQLVFGMGVKAN